MRDKLYMWAFGLSIRKATKQELNTLLLENVRKINTMKANSLYRKRFILQNRAIKKRLARLK